MFFRLGFRVLLDVIHSTLAQLQWRKWLLYKTGMGLNLVQFAFPTKGFRVALSIFLLTWPPLCLPWRDERSLFQQTPWPSGRSWSWRLIATIRCSHYVTQLVLPNFLTHSPAFNYNFHINKRNGRYAQLFNLWWMLVQSAKVFALSKERAYQHNYPITSTVKGSRLEINI